MEAVVKIDGAALEEALLGLPTWQIESGGQAILRTFEFSNFEAYERAQQLSGCWMPWSYLVLEAVVSAEDGYEHPAIVFGNKAFCGFRLLD